MTREECKRAVDDEFCFLAMSDAYSLIDKIYNEFEQRIEELEVVLYNADCDLNTPKTCDGCKYYDEETSYMWASHCTSCKRYYYDYYEPKEQK